MKKNSLKKLNKFVCCLVILSLFLQFVPSREPAQADVGDIFKKAGDWLVKLTNKIALPDITLTEHGSLDVGSYSLFPNRLAPEFLGCAKWDNTQTPPKCTEPVNPFSQFKLSMDGKEVKSQIALVGPSIKSECVQNAIEDATAIADAQNNECLKKISEFELFTPDYIKKQIVGCNDLRCFSEFCSDNAESRPGDCFTNIQGIQDAQLNCYGRGGSCEIKIFGEQANGQTDSKMKFYWEDLGKKYGTFENFKATYLYRKALPKTGEEFWLMQPLEDLSGHNNINDALAETNPAYKNLYDYAIAKRSSMQEKYDYLQANLKMLMPFLTPLTQISGESWGGSDQHVGFKDSIEWALREMQRQMALPENSAWITAGISQEDASKLQQCLSAVATGKQEKIAAAPNDCPNLNKGELTIPNPYIPEICELSIPLPGDNKCEGFDSKCESKILAKNKACIALNRLQESASQEVYSAYKIFNATDPFTDCLFVRNCRTNCSLRMGEVTFTVSLLDIAALFVPGGFLTVIQKILNIVKIINQAWKIYTSIKTALSSGITFLNDLFKVMGSLSSMYASFTNLGLNWSDMLIYGAGSLASQYGGNKLQKIGVSEGGNIGWLKEQGGNALSAGDGLLGGVAAVSLLNIDKVNQAKNGMQDMLGNFAQNNLKFATAKAAAIKANEKIKGSVDKIRSEFKGEPEFSFLFQIETGDTPNAKKKELNSILGDFQLFFRSVDEFMQEIADTGSLKDGRDIRTIQLGTLSDSECNQYDPAKDDLKEATPYYCTTSKDAVDFDFSGKQIIPGSYEFSCWLTNRVKNLNGADGCDWLQLFKNATANSGDWKKFFELINPEHIKKAIVGCDNLSCFDPVCSGDITKCQQNLSCYGATGEDCEINSTNDSWRLYWEQELSQIMGTPAHIVAAYNSAILNHETLSATYYKNALTALYGNKLGEDGKNIFGSIAHLINWYNINSNKNLIDYSQYVNLYEYVEANKTKNNLDTMSERHDYYKSVMVGIFPVLKTIADIETRTYKQGWANTKIDINDNLGALQKTASKATMFFSGGLNYTSENIAKLKQCVDDQLPTAFTSVGGVQYWTNLWFSSTNKNVSLSPLFSGCNNAWIGSYDSDLAYEAWDEKINVLISNYNHFQDVEESLSLGVSPEKPIVVYKIAKANKILESIKTDANKIGNDASWNDIANKIIDSIIYGTPKDGSPVGTVCSDKDCPASGCVNLNLESHVDLIDNCAGGIYQTQIFKYKDDYLNYVNCCKSTGNSKANPCCNYSYQSFGKLNCDVGASKAGEDYAYWANRCDNALPVTKKYKCSGANCLRDDASGTYLTSNCDDECRVVSPKYKCSGDPFYECEVDNSGNGVSWNSCISSCENPNQMFACSGWPDYACRPDDGGDYTTNYCDHKCGGGGTTFKYDCVYGECKEILGGNYTRSNCDGECKTPPPSSNKACGNAPGTTLWCLCPVNWFTNGIATNACIESAPDPCIYRSKADCSAVLNPVNRKYKCSGASCVRDDARGTYTSSDCDGDCGGGGSGGNDSCVPCLNALGGTSYCHPKCGQNCWGRQEDCESDVQGKNTSPFAKIKSFIQKIVKIPQVFAKDLNINCENKAFYDSLQKCYSTNDAKYADGFKAFNDGTQMVADFELQRGDLKKAIEAAATALQNASSILGNKFSQLQKDWNATPDPFAPENQESAIARAQIDKILKLKTNSEDIVNNKIPEVVAQIGVVKANIKTLKDFIDKVPASDGVDKLKDIIDKFDEAIRIINVDVIDFAYAKIGPENIGTSYGCNPSSQQFLYRLKCFEENTIDRTFQQLTTYTDILKNVENAAFGLIQAGENIKAIEPSMDMTPVTIKPNLVNEVDERAQCCTKTKTGEDCFSGSGGKNICTYTKYSVINDKTGETKEDSGSPFSCSASWPTKAKCKEKTSLYVGQQTGTSNYEFFKTNLLANPLSTLEDRFNILSASINNYVMPSMQEAFSGVPKTDTKPAKDALIKNNAVDVDEKKYTALSDDVLKQARYMWWDLIWGNETVSQELLPACNAAEQILTNDPSDIQNQCKNRSATKQGNIFVNISLLPPLAGGNNTLEKYNTLKTQCSALANMDLDVLDNLKDNPDYISQRKAELDKMREGIGVKNIACPKWFCVNQKTFTWGAGAALVDPFCQKVTSGEETGRIINDIVWDTSQVVGPVTDANQIWPEVCNLAGLGDTCNRGDLNLKCSDMMKVDMNEFSKNPPCVKDTRIAEMQTLEQNRLKVGVENCANGLCESRTDGNIACPFWFCINNPLQKMWLLPGNAQQDPFCAEVSKGNVPGKILQGNIVWDTSLVSGQRIWPPNTACKRTDGFCGGQLTEPLDATNFYGPGLGGQWTHKCIGFSGYSQIRLGELQTQTAEGGLVASCPSDYWPCKDKTSCENLQKACSQSQDGSALKGTGTSGDWVWPPEGEPNYTAVQNTCISTQQEKVNLDAFDKIIKEIGGVGKIDELTNNCNNLNYQRDFARDCYDFSVLQKALGNTTAIDENWKSWNTGENDFTTRPPIWIEGKLKLGTGVTTTKDDDVNYTQLAIDGFCRAKVDGKIITETIQSGVSDIGKFFNCSLVLRGLKLVQGTNIDLTAGTLEAQNAREVALKLCSQSTTDMRTPLNEVMKVFSVLLGVKSGTASMNGLSALYFDAQKIRQRAQDVVNLIKTAPDKFKELWNSEDEISKITKDNVDIKYVKCIAGPMTSYAGNGQPLTGANGGQVCPNVGEQFSQLDSSFSQIRQNLQMINMAMIQPRVSMGFGDLSFNIANPGVPDQDLMEVVWPIYEKAKEIKDKSQLLWALATAINYANENCTCGQSYCPQMGPVPLCISGLPLTTAPLTQPFCHLIWTLRYPLGSLAEKLKQELEKPW